MTVIPIMTRPLTTVPNITGHMILTSLIKLSSHNSTHAGVTVPAGRRR